MPADRTPEEVARELVHSTEFARAVYGHCQLGQTDHISHLIAAAIREAVAAERDACRAMAADCMVYCRREQRLVMTEELRKPWEWRDKEAELLADAIAARRRGTP